MHGHCDPPSSALTLSSTQPWHSCPPAPTHSCWVQLFFYLKRSLFFTFNLFLLFLLLAMYRLLQGVPTPCPTWHQHCACGWWPRTRQGRQHGGEAKLNQANSVKAAAAPTPAPTPLPPSGCPQRGLCHHAYPGCLGTAASPLTTESHGDGGMHRVGAALRWEGLGDVPHPQCQCPPRTWQWGRHKALARAWCYLRVPPLRSAGDPKVTPSPISLVAKG